MFLLRGAYNFYYSGGMILLYMTSSDDRLCLDDSFESLTCAFFPEQLSMLQMMKQAAEANRCRIVMHLHHQHSHRTLDLS